MTRLQSGHTPAVVIFDLSSGLQIGQLKGHKFGVTSVCFSPNLKYLVSVGHKNDGFMYVWDWKNNTVVGSAKLGGKV